MEELQSDLFAFAAENTVLKHRLYVLEMERAATERKRTEQTRKNKAMLDEMKATVKKMKHRLRRKQSVSSKPPSPKKLKPTTNGKREVDKLGNYFVVPRTHFVIGHKRKLPCNPVMRLVHCLSKNVEFGYNTSAAFSEYYTEKDVVAYAQTVMFQVFWQGTDFAGRVGAPTAESLYELVASGNIKHVKKALKRIHNRKAIRSSTSKFLNTLLIATKSSLFAKYSAESEEGETEDTEEQGDVGQEEEDTEEEKNKVMEDNEKMPMMEENRAIAV